MRAQDIMTRDPAVITPDAPIARAAELMRDRDVGMIPVVGDRTQMRLEGVLTDRDIAVRCIALGHGAHCLVRHHMTTDGLATARPEDEMDDVIALMEREHVRRIPVVGNDGRLAGIIAQADVAMKVGPRHPQRVEHMLECISEPAHALH